MSMIAELFSAYYSANTYRGIVYDHYIDARDYALGGNYNAAVDEIVGALYNIVKVFDYMLLAGGTGGYTFLTVNAIYYGWLHGMAADYDVTAKDITDAWRAATHDELCDTISGIDFMRKEIWNDPYIKYVWAR